MHFPSAIARQELLVLFFTKLLDLVAKIGRAFELKVADGLAPSTWQREFNRGRTGGTVPDPERPGRRAYALYDPGRAQDGVNAGASITEANQKGNRK